MHAADASRDEVAAEVQGDWVIARSCSQHLSHRPRAPQVWEELKSLLLHDLIAFFLFVVPSASSLQNMNRYEMGLSKLDSSGQSELSACECLYLLRPETC